MGDTNSYTLIFERITMKQSQDAEELSQLKPCPFCGGDPERVDFETVEDDPNAGGTCISCKKCGASSPVHFDRKENLFSSWNERMMETEDYRLAGGLMIIHEATDATADAIRSVAYDLVLNCMDQETAKYQLEYRSKRPCHVCGCAERDKSGYLTCECPAVSRAAIAERS